MSLIPWLAWLYDFCLQVFRGWEHSDSSFSVRDHPSVTRGKPRCGLAATFGVRGSFATTKMTRWLMFEDVWRKCRTTDGLPQSLHCANVWWFFSVLNISQNHAGSIWKPFQDISRFAGSLCNMQIVLAPGRHFGAWRTWMSHRECLHPWCPVSGWAFYIALSNVRSWSIVYFLFFSDPI